MSILPSPRSPTRHGGCPPSAPAAPLSGLREVGPPTARPGQTVPGGGGRYRKCREKPWSFPIWSRGWWRRGRCRRQGVAEPRQQNEDAATPRASAGPARAAPPEPAGPARRPPLRGWLRPTPPRPSGGTLHLAREELGRLQLSRRLLLAPSISPSHAPRLRSLRLGTRDARILACPQRPAAEGLNPTVGRKPRLPLVQPGCPLEMAFARGLRGSLGVRDKCLDSKNRGRRV